MYTNVRPQLSPSSSMAVSNTTSSGPPSERAQLYYQSSLFRPSAVFGGVSDSTVVTAGASSVGSSSGNSTEGRVGKSPRRRARASRRAPTTLLNTDAANFRAIVQQFTGIPSTQPYPRPNIHFGMGYDEHQRQATMLPFNHMQQQQMQTQMQMQTQQYYVQQFQQQQYQQQQSMQSVASNTNGDGYFQEFSGNPREGFFMQDGMHLVRR